MSGTDEPHTAPTVVSIVPLTCASPDDKREQEPRSYDSEMHLSSRPVHLADLETAVDATNWRPVKAELAVMITLAFTSLIVALDSTILVAALPTLASALQANTAQAFWAGSAYLLPYAVCQPLLANLSDTFGRRAVFLACIIIFVVSSVPCAAAKSVTMLLVGRAFQGVGGGGVVALTQNIYTDLVPLRQRPKWFNLVLLAWAIGTIAGPIVGGALADMGGEGYAEGWRWCFWVNLPMGCISLIAAWLTIRLKAVGDAMTLSRRLHMVDCTGGFLFTTSVTSILVAISWGGTQYPWSSWQTICPLLLGLLGLTAFVVYENRFTKHAIMRGHLIENKSAVCLYALAFLYGIVLFMALYYTCFYFSSIRKMPATRSGASMIPALAFALPSSMLCGHLMSRWGRYRWVIWGGHAVEIIGCGLLVKLDENTPQKEWVVILAMVGLGSGMTLTSINFAVQAQMSHDRESASATVMYTFMRSSGMCVGVSIGSTIFQNLAGVELERTGYSSDIAKHAETYLEGLLGSTNEEAQNVRAIIAAFMHGLRAVFICMTTIKAGAFLLSLSIRSRTMDRVLDGRYMISGTGTRR